MIEYLTSKKSILLSAKQDVECKRIQLLIDFAVVIHNGTSKRANWEAVHAYNMYKITKGE